MVIEHTFVTFAQSGILVKRNNNMKTIKEYLLEGNAPIANVLIGDIKRFNGCFADVLTSLKHKGFTDVTLHKESRASGYGLHRMHLEFKPECKSDIDEVLKYLEDKYSWKYEFWKAKVNPKDDEVKNPTIWIMDKI